MVRAASTWEPHRLTQPRFARIADLVARLADEPDWPGIPTLNACFGPELARVGVTLIEAAKTKPVIGADGAIDPSSLYEVRIVEHREVPTRPRNAHDLMNALVWAAFPYSKLALSSALAAVQRARAVGRSSLPATRTPAHDRLALVDEGAVLYVTGARTTLPWIFGHAIYEHAYAGEHAVRATAIDLVVPEIEDLDPIAARDQVDRVFAAADLACVVRAGPGIPLE
jgi:hypothetical protein